MNTIDSPITDVAFYGHAQSAETVKARLRVREMVEAHPRLIAALEKALAFSDHPRNSSDESELCDYLREILNANR